MRIRRRNLPRCSYTTNAKFKFPGYFGYLNAYVKDNNSIIMLNYSSFCRFVLAMMRQRFSHRFNFTTQADFEEDMRPRIKDNLYNLTVLNDHSTQVEREAIDENAVQTIIYNIFDDTVGYDIYFRIHNSIQDIKETAPSPAKCVFEIGGKNPKEVFVQPCEYFSANFVHGKKDIQCIFYEGNIWYKFTDLNRMFGIQRTNLVSNKTNVDDFVIYDGFLYCNDNEAKDAIMSLDISKEEKAKYFEAFDIQVNLHEEEEEDNMIKCEPCLGSTIIDQEATEDKPKKERKHTMKIRIHNGKPNIIEKDKMVTVIAKVDKEVRDKVANLFNDLGLDMSTAINIYFHQCIVKNGIPFEINKASTKVTEENVVTENSPVILSSNEAAKFMKKSYQNFIYYSKKYKDFPIYRDKNGNICVNKADLEQWCEKHYIFKESIGKDYITMKDAIESTKINRNKFGLLKKFKGFPEVKEVGCNRYINKNELKEWIANNYNLVYGKSRAELKQMLNIQETEEEDNFAELLGCHNIETDSLVSFTIDRNLVIGKHPAICEKKYESAMGTKIFNVTRNISKDREDILSKPYDSIKPIYKDYDLTIVDRANLNIRKNTPVEFIFVKDNNAAEHGIGGSLPYDYIFVRAIDIVNTIMNFEDKEKDKAKAYCSIIANYANIEFIRLYNNIKYMQIKDINKLFDYIPTKRTLKDRLRYDYIDPLMKVIIIELDEYVKKNGHTLKYRRKIIDYVDDFYRYYNDGVVNNMARHIFNDKTIKELLNSKDISEFTYGTIIMSEAFRDLLAHYRTAYKNNLGMPPATGRKPTNTIILNNVWDFINKSEYITEVHEGFIRAAQAMEQRYNVLLKDYNESIEEGHELESVFDE